MLWEENSLADMITRQKAIEQEAIDIKHRKEFRDLTSAIEQGRFDETRYGSALMQTYFKPIRAKVQEYLEADFRGHTGKTQRFIKYLCNDADKLAYVILQSLVKKLAQRGNKVKIVSMTGHIIQNLRILQTFASAEETDPKLIAYLGSEYRRASTKRKADLMAKHLNGFENGSTKSLGEDVKAGAVLLDSNDYSCMRQRTNKKRIAQISRSHSLPSEGGPKSVLHTPP
jgi:hypothetical protein